MTPLFYNWGKLNQKKKKKFFICGPLGPNILFWDQQTFPVLRCVFGWLSIVTQCTGTRWLGKQTSLNKNLSIYPRAWFSSRTFTVPVLAKTEFSLNLSVCFSLLSCAVIKCLDQKQLRRKDFCWLLLPGLSSYWEEVKAGTWRGWSYDIHTQEERENMYILACRLGLAHLPLSHIIHDSQPREWCCHDGLCLSMLIYIIDSAL